MYNGPSVLKKALPLIMILGLAIGGAALLIASKPQAKIAAGEEKVWTVDTQRVQPGQHTPIISLYGRIESAQLSRLSAALSSTVLAVLSHEGERVRQGQVLVQLDDRDAQLRLKQRRAEQAEIRAQLDSELNRFDSDRRILKSERQLQALAQQALKRAQRLKKDQLTAQTFIDEAQQLKLRQDIVVAQRQLAVDDHPTRKARLQAQLKKAESLQTLAALEVERCLLRAPFDGRITQLAASPGDRTQPGSLLVELYALDAIQIRAQIPTTQLATIEAALARGQPLTALAHTANGQTLTLHLSHLAGDIKASRGGRDALFTLDTASDALTVGGIVTLQLQLPSVSHAIALPREALYGGDRVYSILDGRLQGHRIERLGETLAGDGHRSRLLVRSDSLKPGDVIVTTQLPNALEGLKVRAKQPHATSPIKPPPVSNE